MMLNLSVIFQILDWKG